jgi:hypothetical protein
MKKLLAKIALTAVVLSPFAAAVPALAAGITVGNPAIARSIVDTYSNFTIIDTNAPVSATGFLTTFSYYAANANSFEFVLVDGANVVKWISPTITPAGVGLQTYNINVPVTAGWNLGVHFDSTGTIPFDFVGAPATYTPNNNGMPIVGQTLSVEGTSGRTYSWNGNGSDATVCSTLTLESSTSTQFKHLTTTDPAGSSDDSLFTLGTPGAAVLTAPDGFPGAWDAASADPDVTGAIWVNNNSVAPSTPAGAGDGQDGNVNAWRLFSQTFNLPAGAVVSSANLHMSADNSVQAFLDNTSVGSALSYTTVDDFALTVTPGAHELEFVVKNDAYDGPTNPTGVIYRADINYCVPVAPPPTECPAAPSIAAAVLQTEGVKSGSTTFKNVISLVAKHMGPQTDFDGINACNAGYAPAVKVFVDANKGVTK